MTVTVLLCGDVMTGRGIDQILPYPGDPALAERGVADARTYVALAEEANGPLPRPVPFTWPWGDALQLLGELAPDVRVLNLETTVTADGVFVPGKAVHYRMNPANAGVLAVARPDVCVLANNHMLDFGPAGLCDTVDTLAEAGLRTAGAGRDAVAAERAAIVDLHSGQRVLVAGAGMRSSGVPASWRATAHTPGVAFVPDLSARSADALAAHVTGGKRKGDVAIVSLHWGSNWGYTVDSAMTRFAHRLIDSGVDIVHGHSSHHPRPIELYQGGLILYGCGDFLNDYEGIRGYEAYRDELRVLYLATVHTNGARSVSLRMAVFLARNMRLNHARRDDVDWLRAALEHVSRHWGTKIVPEHDGTLVAVN